MQVSNPALCFLLINNLSKTLEYPYLYPINFKYIQMTREEMRQWLIEKKSIMSITAIEREIGCPNTTLHQFVGYHQMLPKKWEEKLKYFIKKF